MTESPRYITARRRVLAELHSYDTLSRPSKIVRRDSKYQQVEKRRQVDSVGPDHGYVCGHRISLTLPCPHCNRTVDDCVEYIVALRAKLKELLSQLK